MGTGEESTPAKPSKPTSSNQVPFLSRIDTHTHTHTRLYKHRHKDSHAGKRTNPSSLCIQEIPTTPLYPDWSSSMQVYVYKIHIDINICRNNIKCS
jgi:hypothetical protein